MTREKQLDLLAWLKNGQTLTAWCKNHKHDPHQVFNAMDADGGDSFRQEYYRAREDGAHVFVDDTVRIADEKSGDAMRQKLRVDTRLKVAGMFNKRFSQRPGDADTNKLTLGQLVEAAIAHGKQLQLAEQPRTIDITPAQASGEMISIQTNTISPQSIAPVAEPTRDGARTRRIAR